MTALDHMLLPQTQGILELLCYYRFCRSDRKGVEADLTRPSYPYRKMGLYDEIEIEDMDWNEELQGYTYSCPCGDLFQITVVRCHWPERDPKLAVLCAVFAEES